MVERGEAEGVSDLAECDESCDGFEILFFLRFGEYERAAGAKGAEDACDGAVEGE